MQIVDKVREEALAKIVQDVETGWVDVEAIKARGCEQLARKRV